MKWFRLRYVRVCSALPLCTHIAPRAQNDEMQQNRPLLQRTSMVAHALSDMLCDVHYHCPGAAVAFLSTVTELSAVHPSMLEAGRFTSCVQLAAPDAHGREAILGLLLQRFLGLSAAPDTTSLDLQTVALDTEGYLPCDLVQIVQRALHASAARRHSAQGDTPTASPLLTQSDIESALVGFVPSGMKDLSLTVRCAFVLHVSRQYRVLPNMSRCCSETKHVVG